MRLTTVSIRGMSGLDDLGQKTILSIRARSGMTGELHILNAWSLKHVNAASHKPEAETNE